LEECGQRQRIAELRQLKNFDVACHGAFGIVAYATNRYLTDHTLGVGRMLTHNDVEAMLIWGGVGPQASCPVPSCLSGVGRWPMAVRSSRFEFAISLALRVRRRKPTS